MELGILPNLTKDYILKHISQEQIFEYYLGISVTTDGIFTAPPTLRNGDKNPTCSFYYNLHGKLRLRDWAGYFHGDCMDLVGYLFHINSNDKKGFNIILDQLARDFKLHKYKNKSITGNTFSFKEVKPRIKGKTIIQFQPRNWTKEDADYWKAGNISKKQLEEARIYPCEYVWINNNPIYNYVPKDPAYAYFFTPNDIKIAFPKRKEYRFLTNTSYLQGKDLLEPAEIGIITKSYKDVLSLRSYGIEAVAPSAESILITPQEWFNLKWTCTHWFSLMDFDRQGVVMANKLRKKYNIPPLFFGKTNKFKDFCKVNNFTAYENVKDFYDFSKNFSKENVINTINKTKKRFESTFLSYDKYMNNNLSFIN